MSLAVVPAATADPEVAPRDIDLVRRHLKTALRELSKKRADIDMNWRYYDDDHPTLWLTDKHREVFGPKFHQRLEDNYCSLAVDAVTFRLNTTGFTGVDESVPNAEVDDADTQWSDNELDLEQEELYRAAQVAGEAYVIVWPRADGDGFDIAVNDARYVHIAYASRRRSERAWAAKVWHDPDAHDGKGAWRANVFYPDELVRLMTPPMSATTQMPSNPARFDEDPDDPGDLHDFEAVPVVRFAQSRQRRSRLRRLIPLQNKINKLGANKMVAAEFQAFRQRVILSADETLTSETLRAGAGAVWVFDPGGKAEDGERPPTRIHEFEAAELKIYDDAVQAEIDKFFTLAPLPRHMQVNPGTAPSGEAIRADEGPFVSVIKDLQQLYGGAWSDVYGLLGLRVRPVWADPEVISVELAARAVLALTQANVPLRSALARVLRLTDSELDEIMDEVQVQRVAQGSAGDVLLRAEEQGRSARELLEEGA